MDFSIKVENDKAFTALFRETAEDDQQHLIVWYDQNVYTIMEDLMRKRKFRQLSQYVQTFDSTEQCQEYVRQIRYEKVFLVTSTTNENNQKLVYNVSDYRQISYIFVYKPLTKTAIKLAWKVRCKKMRPIYDHIYILFTELMKDIHLIRKKENIEALSRSKNYLRKEKTIESLKDNFCFDYLAETSYPIYLQNLARIPSHSNDMQRFINQCRIHYQEKPMALKFLDEFEEYYTPQTSILWYTREGFLFRLLNKALRHRDIDGIYLLHFFIVDLFNEISLCSHEKKDSAVCFRGQLISMEELDMLKRQKWFCANSFISATKNYVVAQIFAGHSNASMNGFEHVMFRITISQNAWKTGYVADISKQSYNEDEEEVFFMAGTLFRSTHIYYDEQDRIWYVWLEMYSSNVSPSAYTYVQYCSINMRLLELDFLLHREMNYVFPQQDIYGAEFRNLYEILLKELSPTQDIIQLCSCRDSIDSYQLKSIPIYKNINYTITYPHTMVAIYDCLGAIYYYEKLNFDVSLQYFLKAAELDSQTILNEYCTQRRYFYMACLYKIKGNFKLAWNVCKAIMDESNEWDFDVMDAITYAPQYKTKFYTYSQDEIRNFELFIDYAQIDLDKYWHGILVMYQNLYKNYQRTPMLSLDLAWSCSTKAMKILIKYKADDYVTLLSKFHELFIFTTESFNKCNYKNEVLSRVEEDIKALVFKSSIPYFVKCFKAYYYPFPKQSEIEISWFYELVGDEYASRGTMHMAFEWWKTACQLWNRNCKFSSHAHRCQSKIQFPQYFEDLTAGFQISIEA